MTTKDFKISNNVEVDEYVISPAGAIDGQSLVYDGTAYVPSDIVPVGTVEMWAGSSTPPEGWLLCDGSLYSWGSYTRLRDVIGISYGGSVDVNWRTPNLIPTTKAIVPIGVSAGSSLGNSNVLFGSGDTTHTHNYTPNYTSNGTTEQDHGHNVTGGGDHSHILDTVNHDHYHNIGGPSVSHSHFYLRGNTSNNTANTAHGGHNTSSNVHNHKHTSPDANPAHSHGYNTGNMNIHSHNWGTTGVASTTGGSGVNHSHDAPKQSLYFIIKY